MRHYGLFHLLGINARQTGWQCQTINRFSFQPHYERITKMIKTRLVPVSECFWDLQYNPSFPRAQRETLHKAHGLDTRYYQRSRGNNCGSFRGLFFHLFQQITHWELITVCSLPLPKNMAIHQSLRLSPKDHRIHQSSLNYCLGGLADSDGFYKRPSKNYKFAAQSAKSNSTTRMNTK